MPECNTEGPEVNPNEGQTEAISIDDSFKKDCHIVRNQLEGLKGFIKTMQNHDIFFNIHPPQLESEMKANLMLSYRHLEDARMRIGKVLQAEDGGVSILDKK
jgi:hypothetical protein